MHVGAEEPEICVRHSHTYQMSTVSGREASLREDTSNCSQDGKSLWLQVAAWQRNVPPGGTILPRCSAMAQPKAGEQHGATATLPLCPSVAWVYLAREFTGSAFISQPGKHLRMKTGIKTKVNAATNASYLGILLFYTTDQYFSLSC